MNEDITVPYFEQQYFIWLSTEDSIHFTIYNYLYLDVAQKI